MPESKHLLKKGKKSEGDCVQTAGAKLISDYIMRIFILIAKIKSQLKKGKKREGEEGSLCANIGLHAPRQGHAPRPRQAVEFTILVKKLILMGIAIKLPQRSLKTFQFDLK